VLCNKIESSEYFYEPVGVRIEFPGLFNLEKYQNDSFFIFIKKKFSGKINPKFIKYCKPNF
jgi:hypothetical protein